MNKTLEQVTETVKKLLRLAERGTEHEKKVAMEKAMTVAQGYHIDISLINPDEDTIVQKIDNQQIVAGSKINAKTRYIMWILKKHFNVSVVTGGGRYSGRTITFIGYEQDVAMAKYLISMLGAEFDRLWKSHSKSNGDSARNKNSYFYGLYLGLGEALTKGKEEKIKEKINETYVSRFSKPVSTEEPVSGVDTGADVEPEEESIKAEIQNQFALALVNQKDAVDKEVKKLFPKLTTTTTYIKTRSYSTVEAGRAAGRKISLARPLSYGQSNKLTHA